MSSLYNGRWGPNVSQFLRELNTIPAETPVEDPFSLEDDDLFMFTNSQFFDFDLGQNTDFQAVPGNPDSGSGESPLSPPLQGSADVVTPATNGLAGLDFIPGDFSLDEFSNLYEAPILENTQDNIRRLQPTKPSTHSTYLDISQQQQQQLTYGTAGLTVPKPLSREENARLPPDEDKRRRNTAASARFRIKKKEREQALEKNAKEMTEKVTVLEGRISQLETENKFLKNLLMEKNEGEDDLTEVWDELSSKPQAENVDSKIEKAELGR